MKLQGAKINFLGDSITFGYGTSEGRRFSDLLAKNYGVISRNYGICGTRIARQLSGVEEYGEPFFARVPEMEEDADCVVVLGGVNDFGHGDAPIGQFTDTMPVTFYGALHTLYLALLKRFPAARIVILTPLHCATENNTNGYGSRPVPGEPLRKYVEAIREAAEYYEFDVLDLFAMNNMPDEFVPDGLHPNDEGHAILTDQIAGFLTAL